MYYRTSYITGFFQFRTFLEQTVASDLITLILYYSIILFKLNPYETALEDYSKKISW